MRFATVFLTGALAAFASAQSTTTSAAPALTSQQAAINKCLEACDAGDVNCTSKCIAVPNPNASQVNDTNKCVAACPQGKGTAADNAAYRTCVQDCIGKYYFTSTGTPSQPTAGAGAGSGNGNGSGNDNGNGNTNPGDTNGTPTGTGTENVKPTGSGTATGTGAPAQNTNAAGTLKVGSGVVGLAVLGLLAL